jgi:hypothetical protein
VVSVLSVPEKPSTLRPQSLRELRVGGFFARRARRASIWWRPKGCARFQIPA